MWRLIKRKLLPQSVLANFDDGLQPHNRAVHSQDAFQEFLRLERKRAERSQRRSILMLLKHLERDPNSESAGILLRAAGQLADATRDTDIVGWFATDHIMGVIFTEIGITHVESAAKKLLAKVGDVLSQALTIEEMSAVSIAFQSFPDDRDHRIAAGVTEFPLHRDFAENVKVMESLADGTDRALGLNPMIG